MDGWKMDEASGNDEIYWPKGSPRHSKAMARQLKCDATRCDEPTNLTDRRGGPYKEMNKRRQHVTDQVVARERDTAVWRIPSVNAHHTTDNRRKSTV